MVGTKLDKQHHSCSMHGRRGGVMQRKLYSLIPGFIYIYSIHSKLYAILAFLDINLEKPKCPIIWNLWRSTGASHLFHSLGTCCVIVLLPVPQQLQFFFFLWTSLFKYIIIIFILLFSNGIKRLTIRGDLWVIILWSTNYIHGFFFIRAASWQRKKDLYASCLAAQL